MKKVILGTVFGLLMLGSPFFASAQTLDELQAQIVKLQSRISEIRSSLPQVAGTNTNSSLSTQTTVAVQPVLYPIDEVVPEDSACLNLNYTLKYRSRDISTNGEVSSLQDFLQSQGYLNSEPTGYFGLLTQKAVKVFQKENGISANGQIGPATRAKIHDISCAGISDGSNTNSAPVIDGIAAIPVPINVGQSVSLNYSATDADGDNLYWMISWGDDQNGVSTGIACPVNGVQQKQNWEFNKSHVWTNAGTYKVFVSVTDCRGGNAEHIETITVGGGSTTPSVTVTTPNGGETFVAGDSNKISWSGGQGEIKVGLMKEGATNYSNPSDYLLGWINVKASPNSSMIWDAKQVCDLMMTTCWSVGVGHYKIIAQASDSDGNYILWNSTTNKGGNWDLSDNSFEIISGRTDPPSPTTVKVYSPNGGETWTRGTTQKISWGQSTNWGPDKNVDIRLNPYYAPCTGTICPMYPYQMPYTIAKNVSDSAYAWIVGKNLDTSRTISDGSYIMEICVTGTDICDKSDSYFKISNSTTVPMPVITILTPKESDYWAVGSTYRISWKPFSPTSDIFVYLSGGGHEEGFSKYITSPVGGNSYVDYKVTSADLPVNSGNNWAVAVCNGKLANGGTNCGWSGSIWISSTTRPDIFSVITPNGGERNMINQPFIISWNRTIPGVSRIDLLDEFGNFQKTIFSGNLGNSVPNTSGYFVYTPTYSDLGYHQIRVYEFDSTTYNVDNETKGRSDTSDSAFSFWGV